MTPSGPAERPRSGSVALYRASLRKAIRRNAHEPEINFLNITAMLDIMTIILVFLLKTLGESSAAVPQSDDLRLPTSVVQAEPAEDGVIITISKSQIMVGENKVLSLPARASLIQDGVGAANRRDAFYIVSLGTALQAARKTDAMVRRATGKDPSQSEAIIIADMTTPYRLLVEVLYTLGQSEFGNYHLKVIQSKKKD